MAKKRARSSKPTFQRGPRGPKGERGDKGEPGPQGPARENGLADRVAELRQMVDQLKAESEVQLRRIADLQAQLDITLGEFRHIQQPEGEKPLPRLHKRN